VRQGKILVTNVAVMVILIQAILVIVSNNSKELG
jgi:hypothetical protein